ncbi:putative HDA1 complex subunit, partial [Dactylonectria estremocensis]
VPMPGRRRQRKPNKRSSKASSQTEQWFTIRQILDERTVKGRVEYLVDWDDNTITGEAYPPSWSEEVTDVALQEWEDGKRATAEDANQELPESSPAPAATAPAESDVDDSQEPRPSNWRRSLKRTNVSGDSDPLQSPSDFDEPPTKKVKTDTRHTPSEDPAPSIVSTGIADPEIQSPKSVRSEDFTRLAGQKLAIELTKPSEFDPTEYHSVVNTQSSQLVSELEDEDSRAILASQLSQRTIPDSQDRPEQSWAQSPVETPITPTPPQLLDQRSSRCCIPVSSLVVSDSQGHSFSCPESGARSSQGRSPVPTHQESSTQPQQEIVPNSERSSSDIPSRQPEPPPPHSLGSPDLSTGPELYPVKSPVPEIRVATPATPSGVTHEPVFLTQPPRFPDSPVPSSYSTASLAIRALQQSGDTDESYGHGNRYVNEPIETRSILQSTPGESQAAQAVPRGFESSYTNNPIVTHYTHQTTASQLKSNWERLTLESAPGSQSNQPRPESQSRKPSAVNSTEPGPSTISRLQTSESGQEPQGQEYSPAKLLETNFSSSAHSQVMRSSVQDVPPPSISPASIMVNPEQSAVESMREMVNLTFGDASNLLGGTLLAESSAEVQQGTVSPADISNTMEPVNSTRTMVMPFSGRTVISSGIGEISGQPITMGQGTDQQQYTDSSSSSQHEEPLSEHIVTLPFQASRRPYYDETLLEYRLDAEKFGEFFSSEVYKEPDEALVKRIDELLGRLMNICDYPQDLVGTRLEDLPANEQAKYSTDANPKFNFMSELLQTIEKETEVLILARTPELLRLLFAQTEALELESVCQSTEPLESSYKDSPVRVTLALSTEDLDPFKFDVVIGFDHTFNSSPVSQRLSSSSNGGKPPLVLQLVTTHSIEHIALRLPQEISALERKNALLSGIVQARRLIDDPDRGYGDPHEVAEVFSNYLNGFTESISWEPQSIPDYVIDFYLTSQPRSQMPAEKSGEGNGLKRKLDSDDSSDDAKRMRVLPVLQPVLESNDPPLTYALRELLNTSKPKDAAGRRMSKISVPLAVLEALAEKVSDYQRQAAANDLDTEHKAVINGLEKRLKEFERTANKVSESHRKALQDRSSFEKAKLKADKSVKAAVEAAQKEAEKNQKRIAELEATVARLTSTPGASGTEESPLARTEKLFEESQKKVKLLEKRLENAQKEADYIRNLYQDVNSTAGGLGAEIKGLRQQNEDLERKASDNLVRIHQIQADNANKELFRTLSDLKIQLREREVEVAHLREELSLRNGRPATRQASVPRSPRMGMMSPRPGRVFGSASRGTSPSTVPGYDGNGSGGIPGVQFMGQQPGNGRWGHLRD